MPTIQEGSLVVAYSLDVQHLHVGQVITFRLVTQTGMRYVTHRISNIKRSSGDLEYLETKGDANTNGDTWKVIPDQVLGRVVVVIPLFGYVVTVIQDATRTLITR